MDISHVGKMEVHFDNTAHYLAMGASSCVKIFLQHAKSKKYFYGNQNLVWRYSVR